MKITYIHQYFNTPGMAGGTRSYEMARRMVSAGHQVNMITAGPCGRSNQGQWERENVDGIKVHRLAVPYDNKMGYLRRILAFGDFALRASQYAARIDADVVFATSTPLTVAIPAVRASRLQRAPMVFEVRDLWPELPIAMGALNFPFAKAAARRLEKWAYRESSRIVGLSPGMCAGVIQTGYPDAKVHCVPNSSDIELFEVPEEQGIRFRAARPWLGDRPLVIYAGTFGRINGVAYLAELAAAMRSLDPEVRFLAVGDGAERASVTEKAANLGVLNQNFFIEDPLPKSEMPALFSASTVSLSLFIPLKAMWHNSANKFFDALAAGRPIAINYGGWQAELLKKTAAGIRLDEDGALGASQLLKFLNNNAALHDARTASRRLAHESFSRDKLAKDLMSVLEQAVSSDRGR